MNISQKVQQLLNNNGFFKNDHFLIGLSGGPDSLTLFWVLKNLDWNISTAYFDHQLREVSSSECKQIQDLCEHFEIPFYTSKANIKSAAKDMKISIEEAAREYRYTFLFKTAERIGAKAVAVGHNANDQVETVLMHIIRGSGSNGLKGMDPILISQYHTKIALIRPLLTVWRDEIIGYCSQENINPILDETNLESDYFRNRIRNKLIPELETYNPEIKQRIYDLSKIISADVKLQNKLFFSAYKDVLIESTDDLIKIKKEKIQNLSLSEQRGIFKITLEKLYSGKKQVNFKTIDRLIQFLANPSKTNSLELKAGVIAEIVDDLLVIRNKNIKIEIHIYPQLLSNDELAVVIPFEIEFENGWILTGKQIGRKEISFPQNNKDFMMSAAFDLSTANDPKINIRKHFPGERFQPMGMNGKTIKISDFFINKKIPQSERKNWPMVFLGNYLLWIPGFQPSSKFLINSHTEKVILFKIQRNLYS